MAGEVTAPAEVLQALASAEVRCQRLDRRVAAQACSVDSNQARMPLAHALVPLHRCLVRG